ncbi:hypothetical protein EXIGLDRAFT_706328 [Exidia glandulosa HHB12029]|uniref:Uncharacterized protein n=1 Tax=Exidia glandulosa HHB12029 TaxID=1314781 RepID=A0A165K7K0_EXIGL|nr:hypothetical protein EXIGLDRAFT_706328 [Exidia glandulosa HHB12029]
MPVATERTRKPPLWKDGLDSFGAEYSPSKSAVDYVIREGSGRNLLGERYCYWLIRWNTEYGKWKTSEYHFKGDGLDLPSEDALSPSVGNVFIIRYWIDFALSALYGRTHWGCSAFTQYRRVPSRSDPGESGGISSSKQSIQTLSLPPRVASLPKTVFSDALAPCRLIAALPAVVSSDIFPINRLPLKIPQELEPHDDVARARDCVVESCTSPSEFQVLALVPRAQLWIMTRDT